MIRIIPNSTKYPIAVAAVIVLFATVAWADPGGSATKIDQHVVIRIDVERVTVDYTLTMNRAGAYQEVLAIDNDRDGVMSREEQETYFKEISQQLATGLELSVNGCEQSLQQVGEVQLSMPFTKRIQYQANGTEGQTVRLEFHNDNYLACDGDVSISVEVTEPVQLTFNSLDDETTETSVSSPSVEQQRDLILCYQTGFSGGDRHLETEKVSSSIAASSSELLTDRFARYQAIVGLWLLSLGIAVFVMLRRNWSISSLAIIGLIAFAVSPTWVYSNWHRNACQSSDISDDEAERIFSRLHNNIYRALTAETEDELYDTLAVSVEGELLNETYLKMRRLTFARDLATGFQVRRIKPLASVIVRESDNASDGFCVHHRWRVYGIVSHAGHRHARVNEYEATFSIGKNQDGWRITEANVHDYFRTDPGIVFAAMLR